MPGFGDSVVRRLLDAGVGAIYGVPGGGGNLDLVEAAGRAGLRFVLTTTETGAALAALAHAEVTGRPGACLATLGPGAASLVNGVACAFLDRAPVLVFTDRHPLGAGDRYTHQQLDQRALFGSITKYSATLSGAALDTALRAALDPPCGPVHLDCPDDADFDADDGGTRPAAAMPDDWRGPLRALAGRSTRPMVIAGLGARTAGAASAIREFCTRRGLPVLVTYKAKGVVADGDPACAGVFTNGSIERPLIEASDLIVGVGLDPVELLPRAWPFGQPVISIARWPMATSQVPFAVQCVGDIAEGLAELDRRLPPSAWSADLVARERHRLRTFLEIPAAGLTAWRVVDIAAARLAQRYRVTVDAGAHMVPATVRWPADQPNDLLISNGLSTMGFALPAAIGAAIADPDRPVVALTGDGGLLMCAGELATAARERLPIIVIVFNDGSLSLIEIKQQRKQYSPAGVGIGSIDWTALARGFGVEPFVARDEAGLAAAVDAAARRAGPGLIEARIDRSTYARTFELVRG